MNETEKQSAETLGGYCQAPIVKAARESAEHSGVRISRWVADAIEQRLDREGRLPHQRTEADEAIERAKAAIEEVGGGVLIDAIDRLLDERAEKEVPA